MSNSLTLEANELELLVTAYQSQLTNINNELEPLRLKVSDLEAARDKIQLRINDLLGNSETHNVNTVTVINAIRFPEKLMKTIVADATQYNQSLSYTKKVEYFLLNQKLELSTREVFEKIVELQPELREKEVRVIEALSTVINKGIKDGKYIVGNTTDAKGKKRFKRKK